MVRREGKEEEAAEASAKPEPCCTALAGESPASVSAGAPSSRVQPNAERRAAERTVKGPLGGSNEAGRNQVKAEQASSEFQGMSRRRLKFSEAASM